LESLKARLKEMYQRGVVVEITILWTCGSILITETGKIVGLTAKDLILLDNEGRVSTLNLFNVLDVQKK